MVHENRSRKGAETFPGEIKQNAYKQEFHMDRPGTIWSNTDYLAEKIP